MKYQKRINLLRNDISQPSKFRIKKCVDIINDTRGMYNTDSQIKIKGTVDTYL